MAACRQPVPQFEILQREDIVEIVLKKWLKPGEDPRDFYELIDCRRLETRHEVLLDAINQANEFFFQCQEHGDSTARKRAREFQRQLAEARHILGNPARWEQYDQQVRDRIALDFDQFRKQQGNLSGEEIKDWLQERQLVAAQQIDAILDELLRLMPQEVALVEFEGYEDSVVEVHQEETVPTAEIVTTISQTHPQVAPAPTPSTTQQVAELKRKFAIVGIDLGTTFSAIAYVDHQGNAQVVCNPEDQQRPILPSAVFFEEGEALIGQTALDNAYLEPNNVVQFAKRSLGERKTFEVDGQTLSPETVSALILKKLIHFATPAIGPIDRVVITVPAFFNEKRRAATVQCGEIAGLKVEATLNEPSAALIAYGLHTDPALETGDSQGKLPTKNYIVYDLGGGTFDVTVMAVSQNRVKELATGGNRELGGHGLGPGFGGLRRRRVSSRARFNPKDTSESLQALMAACTRRRFNCPPASEPW